MKNLFTILISFLVLISTFSQTPTLQFDGINDYVSFGTDAASNARTIEFWFSLSNSVDANLQNEIFLFGTEMPDPNVDEWHLTLTRNGTVNPAGTLRFVYVENVGVVSQVYSDSTSWDANRWYHVAVVIDPVEGMMMFVDGFKQNAVQPNFTTAIMPNGASVEVGRQLNYNRYFEGAIDDLRTSSDALYLSDFTPPCPDLTSGTSTIGLWNFNENTGTVTSDVSGNNHDGQIFGAIWSSAEVCPRVSVDEESFESPDYYPNPTTGEVHFSNIGELEENSFIVVYNGQGQIIINEKITSSQILIDLSNQESGMYSFQIISKESLVTSGKIVKQ